MHGICIQLRAACSPTPRPPPALASPPTSQPPRLTGQSKGPCSVAPSAPRSAARAAEGSQSPMAAQMEAGGTDSRSITITMFTSTGTSCAGQARERTKEDRALSQLPRRPAAAPAGAWQGGVRGAGAPAEAPGARQATDAIHPPPCSEQQRATQKGGNSGRAGGEWQLEQGEKGRGLRCAHHLAGGGHGVGQLGADLLLQVLGQAGLQARAQIHVALLSFSS